MESDDLTSSKEEIVSDEQPESKEETFLERVLNLVSTLKGCEGYGKHAGIENFKTVVTMTVIGPNDDPKVAARKEAREIAIREVFAKFYMNGRDSLIKGHLSFLLEGDHTISVGKNGKTFLPISEIYKKMEEEDPASTVSIDASVFFISQHVCPDDDLDEILSTCSEFTPKTFEGGGNFLDMIGTVVSKVTARIENSTRNMEGEDGKLSNHAVRDTVQDLLGDEEITGPMRSMMNQITGDDFDINQAARDLFSGGSKSK